jgi:hypothetical protein
MDKKVSHLQMLQGVIIRMAGNSFLLKGWSVTLLSALFALAAAKANAYFIYLTYFPVVVFWALDGYYLRQERLFRALYDRVRVLPDDGPVDFSMDTRPVEGSIHTWLATCFSVTLRLFYGALFGSIMLIMFILVLNR